MKFRDFHDVEEADSLFTLQLIIAICSRRDCIYMSNMFHLLTTLLLFLFLPLGLAPADAPLPSEPPAEFVERTVIGHQSETRMRFYHNHQLFSEGWDTLPQARFWHEIMALSHDSVIINVASARMPLYKIPVSEWHCQTETEKSLYKSNLCVSHNLSATTTLFVTGGKRLFFEFRKVLPMISRSLDIFEKEGVDPWYAQTILLIESPGKTEASSYVGARGPFQLMPYVARKYGLVVSRTRDDRTNLDKSATAAARLISNICLPLTRKMLEKHGVSYDDKALWFRLLVMHVYHAGAGNVALVIDKIRPNEGGMTLIRKLWQTEAGGFKNESQNYTQLALAALIRFDRLINSNTDKVYLVEGDHRMRDFLAGNVVCVDTLNFLMDSFRTYGNDLMEGMIPVDYYRASIEKVARDYRQIQKRHGSGHLKPDAYFAELIFETGNDLMTKRNYRDAALIYHISLEFNPLSPITYEALSRAYLLSGNKEMAQKYALRSKKVAGNPTLFIIGDY